MKFTNFSGRFSSFFCKINIDNLSFNTQNKQSPLNLTVSGRTNIIIESQQRTDYSLIFRWILFPPLNPPTSTPWFTVVTNSNSTWCQYQQQKQLAIVMNKSGTSNRHLCCCDCWHLQAIWLWPLVETSPVSHQPLRTRWQRHTCQSKVHPKLKEKANTSARNTL